MAGKFVQGNWLLPNNVNANKQSNYSFYFDGSSYVDMPDLDLGTEHQRTYSMWINLSGSSIPNAYQTLIGSNVGAYKRLISINSTYVQYKVGLSNDISFTYGQSITAGNWHHIVITQNLPSGASNFTAQLFVDGTLIQTKQESAYWLNQGQTSQANRIGASNTPDRYTTGKIDEVSIFTRVLSSSEVSSLYNSGVPGNPFDLSGDPVAYYKLGETAIGQAPGGTWNWQVPNHAQSQQAIEATNANDFTQLVTPITQLGNTHTLSIWINSNGNTGIPIGQFFVQGNISSYYNPYTNSADGVYITTDSSNNQGLPLSSIIYRSNSNQLTASIGQLDDDNWHNLIIVRTPTAVKAYIDGGSELTLSGATLTANDTYLLRFLTGIYSAQGAAWSGLVSNAAVWLSDRSSEVANIYNGGEPQAAYTTAPDYWWKLDNSTKISTVPPTTGTTPIINYKTISSNTLTTFNSKTAVINHGYGFSSGIAMLFDNQINLGTQNTVSYWLLSAPFQTSKPKFNTHGGGVNIFANYSDQVGVGTYGGAYILKGPVNDVITFEIYNSTSSSEKATLTFSQANNPTEYAKIFDLNYHNWMFVRDGSNVSFYFDNVLIDSSTSLNATNNTVLVRFSGTMGTAASPTANWGGNKFSNGVEVDEISLFNKALSSSERATLYNSGNAGDISSLSPSIWYNGDSVDFTNSKMLDLSGNSNDASLVNTNNGSSNTGLLTNFQQFLIYKEGAFAGGSAGTAGLALVNTDLGLHNPLYSQFSNFFNNTASDRISIPYVLPAGTTKFSVSIWGNIPALTTSVNKCLIAQQPTGGTTSEGFSIFTSNAYPNTNVWFKVENNTSTQTTSNIVFGEWFHILATYDSGTAKIYFNGVLEDTTTGVTSPLTTVNTTQTILGSLNPSGITIPMEGNLDDCAIWSGTTLTDQQAAQIYNNGKPSDISSLSPTNWWKLGDSSYTNSSNYYVFPNEISNAPDGISHTAYKPSISAHAPEVLGPGATLGFVELDKKGDAPNSTNNAISYNILKTDQSIYTPKYVSQYTVDNNYSMAFDGVDDYFSIGTNIDVTGNKTFSFWIKRDANAGANDGGILSIVPTGATSDFIDLAIFQDQIQGVTANGNANQRVATTISKDVWIHIAVVKNSSAITNIYINGVNQTLTSGGQWSYNAISTPRHQIGKSTGYYFHGLIDEVAIFDTALTDDQIKFDIYGASTTANKSADFINNPNLPNPVAWYRMGD